MLGEGGTKPPTKPSGMGVTTCSKGWYLPSGPLTGCEYRSSSYNAKERIQKHGSREYSLRSRSSATHLLGSVTSMPASVVHARIKLACDSDAGDRCRVVSFCVAAGRGGVSIAEGDGGVRRTGYSRGSVDVGGGGVLEGAASLGERRMGRIGIHQFGFHRLASGAGSHSAEPLEARTRQARQVEHFPRKQNGAALDRWPEGAFQYAPPRNSRRARISWMDDGGESLRRQSTREKRSVKSSINTRVPLTVGIGRRTKSTGTASEGPGFRDDRRREKSQAKRTQSRRLYNTLVQRPQEPLVRFWGTNAMYCGGA